MLRKNEDPQYSLASQSRARVLSVSTLSIIAFAAFVTLIVYRYAWVSEDFFITARYVSNTLDSYGAVFNPGEYVQGYTHPLWYILLLVGSLLVPNLIHVAVGYGLLFTFATVVVLGRAIHRLASDPLLVAVLLGVFSVLSIMSDPWLSFQTSGLENSLTHLLLTAIIVECCVHGVSRPGWLTLLVCLLCLNRPDLVLFALPIGVLLLARVRSLATLRSISVAILPAVIWLVFAWRYYGSIMPNSAAAKMGIYPTWADAARQGLAYLVDWLTYDTLAAGGTFVLLAVAIAWQRSRPAISCIGGAVLYLLWIVWVGGDFMRGRLLLPVFAASLPLGLMAVATKLRASDRSHLWSLVTVGTALLVLFVADLSIPDPGTSISESGIVNERKFYPGYHLTSYLERRRLINPYMDLSFADELRAYTAHCGWVTIHARNPGTLGYLAGPSVRIIDTLGLTDRYIAQLPREQLVERHPRPGHPDKYIPVSYLASRRDISILTGWVEGVRQRDCSLPDRAYEHAQSTAMLRAY